MSSGKNSTRIAAVGAAFALGLAGSAERAGAQDFKTYCETLANGKALEMPLDPASGLKAPATPDGPPDIPVFQNGQLTPQGLDALSAYLADIIGAACNTDIRTAIEHVNAQILFVVYPSDVQPFGIDPKTLEQIQSKYRTCIREAIEFADDNGNGLIEEGLEISYLEEDHAHCNDQAASHLAHEQRLAENAAEANRELEEANRELEEVDRELEEANRELEEADRELEEANRELEEADRELEEIDQRIAKARAGQAAAQQRIAASKARQEAFINDWLEDIINDR